MNTTHAQEQTRESDGFDDVEGPLFYALPQSVRDGLVAHFRALQAEPADCAFETPEMRQAA